MKSSKTMLALALMAIVMMAWAGGNGVTRRARPDDDNKKVVQVRPTDENEERPDQATQSKPDEDQAPRARDSDAQPSQQRSEDAQPARSERNPVQAPQYKTRTDQAPNFIEQQERKYTEPTRVQSTQSYREEGETNIPQKRGEPRRPRGGSSGGYQGGSRSDPFDRRPSHFFGGGGWHGRHDEWRHRHFRGSWRFLFAFGPTIYYAPIHYPYVIRIPHDRVGVYVRYTGDDDVGARFADAVREQLSEEGLLVVYSQDAARLELYIVSMEQDPEDPGYNSAISVSYIWYPGNKFITAQMVDAGLNEVDDLAASVVGYADQLVEDYR